MAVLLSPRGGIAQCRAPIGQGGGRSLRAGDARSRVCSIALRQRARCGHLSPRTKDTYLGWARRIILHHGKRHPAEMGEPEVRSFLTAVEAKVSASTQNQALSALLFL